MAIAANPIGLLGGTFDPVHNAHLAMARAALEQLPLQKVVFIPTGAPRYREPAAASGEHRLAMLALATRGEPRFEIDARELAPGATGYTVDTLEAMRLEQPWLLIGADQHQKFDSWHRPQDVRKLARIAVFSRPGSRIDDPKVRIITMPEMNISASDIRARIIRGEDFRTLLPPAVADYIARHRLYR